ncbi:IS4 family transposase [Chitinibacter bivalviorum]|uniref:IS4 family transposase n=1 Tax=Chitinibacter bivalviorum TaxID=2739434 RepID=UPI001FE9FF24|nr:IS4 family transposase [Chitinibacter bivalviorum]
MQQLLHSLEFRSRHRQRPQDFTRNTTFTFPRVAGILLAGLQQSLQVEVDQFFDHLDLPDGRLPNDDAFRMARKKLKESAYIELRDQINHDLPSDLAQRWHSWRIIAADSTTLYLPNHADIRKPEHFNVYDGANAPPYSLARAAALCETSTGLILCADLDADRVSERELLLRQLPILKQDDLLVLDRGYPAHWLFALLLERQQAFCMRLYSSSYNPLVTAFARSDRMSEVITITPNRAQYKSFNTHGIAIKPFKIRLVKVILQSGMIEILATSLLNEVQYPHAEFAALYHRRWRIEEAFRNLKCRLKLEQFGGETPLAVRQEFHAAILLHNLASLACEDALRALPAEQQALFHANLSYAASQLRHQLPRLLSDPKRFGALFDKIIVLLIKQVERLRPDRSGPPRNPSRIKPRYHRAYK